MEHLEEEKLKAKYREEGSEKAVVLLWEAHREFVLSKAFAYLENRPDTLDIASITKQKFLVALKKGSILGRCRPWLGTVVHNACMDKFRQDKRNMNLLAEAPWSQMSALNTNMAEKEKQENAWSAVRKVLESYKVADQYLIIAFYIKGQSAKDLAKSYKETESFVYEKTRRFLNEVREILGVVNRGK